MNLRSIVVVLALFALVACSEPLEFADWTIPVPEGTRIIVVREDESGTIMVKRYRLVLPGKR